MAGVVWILGAGFSRPLGGPLLPQLLSKASRARTLASFRDGYEQLRTPAFGMIRKMLELYGWENTEPAARAWRDAEEFLELLDFAAESQPGSSVRRVVAHYCGSGKEFEDSQYLALSLVAKRLVAAECCFFAPHEAQFEKWAPYRQWARQLKSSDTVVTFNYDTVVEAVASEVERPIDLGLPAEDRAGGATCVLKLHGSVGWQRRSDGGVVRAPDPTFAVACPPEELCIASPGPSKGRFASTMKHLWDKALQAIKYAEAVVFVGYRFPPSDAIARERVLRALAETGTTNNALIAVHTVLGPNRDPDSVRLEQMLHHALRDGGRDDKQTLVPGAPRPGRFYEITAWPLWAEDFLGLVRRDALPPSWE